MFCFYDTPTTESYTYRHTLSLHDALPICAADEAGGLDRRPNAHQVEKLLTGRGERLRQLRVLALGLGHDQHIAPPLRQETRGGRSEEHTSELQSLMRISYAVFCLKTKK